MKSKFWIIVLGLILSTYSSAKVIDFDQINKPLEPAVRNCFNQIRPGSSEDLQRKELISAWTQLVLDGESHDLDEETWNQEVIRFKSVLEQNECAKHHFDIRNLNQVIQNSKENRIDWILANLAYLSKYRKIDTEIEELRNLMGNSIEFIEFLPQIRKLQKQGEIVSNIAKDQCSPLNLLEEMPPNYSQGRQRWCYASAASDLLYFKLGQIIAPAAIAESYSRHFKKLNLKNQILYPLTPKSDGILNSGGIVKLAVESSLKDGLCKEDYFPTFAEKELIHSIKTQKSRAKQAKHTSSRTYFDLKQLILFVFPEMNEDQLSKVLTAKTEGRALRKLVQAACHGKRFNVNLPSLTQYPKEQSSIFSQLKKLDEQLSKNNIVALSVDSKLMTFPDSNLYPSKTKSFHAMTAIGRRWNEEKGSCEYLIRNSYGDKCRGYSKDYECMGGNLWIAKDQLARHLVNITYWSD